MRACLHARVSTSARVSAERGAAMSPAVEMYCYVACSLKYLFHAEEGHEHMSSGPTGRRAMASHGPNENGSYHVVYLYKLFWALFHGNEFGAAARVLSTLCMSTYQQDKYFRMRSHGWRPLPAFAPAQQKVLCMCLSKKGTVVTGGLPHFAVRWLPSFNLPIAHCPLGGHAVTSTRRAYPNIIMNCQFSRALGLRSSFWSSMAESGIQVKPHGTRECYYCVTGTLSPWSPRQPQVT